VSPDFFVVKRLASLAIPLVILLNPESKIRLIGRCKEDTISGDIKMSKPRINRVIDIP
jgi:hypothetical protein